MAVDLSMPVLVVDDYNTMIRIIRSLLKQLGFTDIDDASEGKAALAKMRQRRYGLVISDWNMEPMTGYELLKQVRAGAALSQTPASVAAGGNMTATWSGIASPSATDWIAIYRVGEPDSAYNDWVYVNCTQAPTSPAASGTCTTGLQAATRTGSPLTAGSYQLRLFANNSFTRLATSNNFTVP